MDMAEKERLLDEIAARAPAERFRVSSFMAAHPLGRPSPDLMTETALSTTSVTDPFEYAAAELAAPEWTDVRVERFGGSLWSVAASRGRTNFSETGSDPIALIDLLKAREDAPDAEEETEEPVLFLNDNPRVGRSEQVASSGVPQEFQTLIADGETAEDFSMRMRLRWQYLKHIQIDGSKPTIARALPDMTEEERAELADLTARNSNSKWLE